MLIHKQIVKALGAVAKRADKTGFGVVRLEPTGEVVATDGHVLLKAAAGSVQPIEEFPAQPKGAPEDHKPAVALTEPASVPYETLNRVIKGCPTGKRSGIPVLDNVAVSITAAHVGTLVATDLDGCTVASVDTAGRYPNWRGVLLPEAEVRGGLRLTLSSEILQSLLVAAKALGARQLRFTLVDGEKYYTNRATGRSYTGSVHVELRHGRDDVPAIDGVLMPMRDID